MERFSKIVVGLLVPLFLQGQTSSATTIALDSITLEAFRIQKQANRLPFAVSVRDFSTTQDQRHGRAISPFDQVFFTIGLNMINSNTTIDLVGQPVFTGHRFQLQYVLDI